MEELKAFFHFALNTEAKKQHLLHCLPAGCPGAQSRVQLPVPVLQPWNSTVFPQCQAPSLQAVDKWMLRFGFVSPHLVHRSFYQLRNVGDRIQAKINLKANHKQLFYACVFQQT